MKNAFENYLNSISKKFKHPETSEMGYRTDFEILLKDIFEKVVTRPRIDHDAKAKDGNKPDFAILKHDISILYIETKDIGVDLNKIEKSEQMARYFGYTNLVLTDYVEFRFYRNGQRYDEPIKIAEYDLKNRTINPFPDSFEHAAKTLIDFTQSQKEPIKNGLHLAKIMGGKAQRIRDNLLQFLSVDSEKNNEIKKIYKTLQKLLVHDLKAETFADMYAQTLVYGLFVARYHDKSPENFSRREARELVPTSNPFLRHFFDHIVGPDFDKRLEYIVDELCEVFSHANVPELMKQYFRDDLWGKTNEGPDPVIHFYEDFLREYDAGLRKKLGAYYTPQPVVRFIVRAVDHLLQKEFGLPNGLADTTKTQNDIHKVQILDPAVGTGTFLSAVIRSIYLRLKDNGQLGRWTTYVHHDLLPRIHGFEIMMAPYTIAHLKLSMAFKATGFKHFNRRLGIYLTNSLEEADEIGDLFTGFGFAESIAEESKEAAQIKNDTPIMVVIGNPPYSVSSSNKGDWITNLIKDYKKDLNERNIQPLSDDYIKFIRYAEHYIEKNGSGIVAMITNNSFLDGIIHRQMRKHLLETFDEIYILDLHGNAKKKETAPDGSKDENVFDIQQGVAISIMIKKVNNVGVDHHRPRRNDNNNTVDENILGNENIRPLRAIVKFAELYGKREIKFEKLNENKIDTIKWKKLKTAEPNYFFVEKDFESIEMYEKGFKIDEIFSSSTSGVKTHNDGELVSHREFAENNYKYLYRPFDVRNIEYDLKKVVRHRFNVMKNMLQNNISLLTCRQQSSFDFQHVLITKVLSDICSVSLQTKESTYAFPLYLYTEDGEKVPNLNQEIVNELEKTTGKTEPKEILDYIYAVLHSPSYREKYKEFLKIDFPRVPYPKDKTTFNKLVKLGTKLREIHLLESPVVNKFITTFPNDGSYEVGKIKYVVDANLASPKNKNVGVDDDRPQTNNSHNIMDTKFASTTGHVYINETQYFGNVPESAWNFYIGGYQPAQKWLKDRKGRTLTNEDIEHYQKIIVALTETDRLMKEINKIDFI
ncbi:MAG: N-6 DNA methylase [Melioribacteraceae bacterium]|nr:MAG: N-6 DNA methylase [Melioribacteraceae bacterium]